jgi:DNA polymerase I
MESDRRGMYITQSQEKILMTSWLILDTPFLCYRGYYAIPGLSHDGKATSVAFAVLRDVVELQELFSTKNIIFTFDYGEPKRLSLYPSYKQNRNKKVEDISTLDFSETFTLAIKNYSQKIVDTISEEIQIKFAIKEQIDLLREKYLYELGFRNILFEDGFEADDIIASLCQTITENSDDKCIIVSSDKDLYQLLKQDRVSMYDPRNKKSTTEDSFKKEWGIDPSWWWRAKAIAGCHTDGIAGVPKVGEKTACKYIAAKLKSSTKAYKTIENSSSLILDNEKLVKLPFPGTPKYSLRKDEVGITKWRDLTKKLGMTSLVSRYPLSAIGGSSKRIDRFDI